MPIDVEGLREQHGRLEGHRLPLPHVTEVWASIPGATKASTSADLMERDMSRNLQERGYKCRTVLNLLYSSDARVQAGVCGVTRGYYQGRDGGGEY
jgi:hypothetical protein